MLKPVNVEPLRTEAKAAGLGVRALGHWGCGDPAGKAPHQRQCSVGIYEGYLLLVSPFFTTLVSRYVCFTCVFLTFELWERMKVYMLLFF